MSTQNATDRRAAEAIDLVSVEWFEGELRRVAPAVPPPPIEHPLNVAVRRIEKDPAFPQSRILARVLNALTFRRGEFRRAEIAALDAATRAMVIELMDVHAAGTSTREDWLRAVEAANAAQCSAES